MSVIWHLIKKDFFRLRIQLAFFSLLVVGEIVFYACISGVFSAPNIEWLRRMQSGPEFLFRSLAEPIFAYVLVGWLVFEDSPLEQDAHWLTRPISGGQLFGAKFITASLMFVLWPLTLNVIWWTACGVGHFDLIISIGEFVEMNMALVALGLVVAALTGGFPRFVLWSLVTVVVLVMIQMFFPFWSNPGFGVRVSRLLFNSYLGGLVAVGIAYHQFATRRYGRSLMLVVSGLVMIMVTVGIWRWDLFGKASGLGPESPGSAHVSAKLTGPVSYLQRGRQPFVQLPISVDGLPEKVGLARVTVRGDWSFSGEKSWTSQAVTNPSFLWREAIRRQLGFVAPAKPDGQVVINLPFSLPLAQRAVRDHADLQARIEIALVPGEILAELPLRDGRNGAYSVSHVSSGLWRENQHGNSATINNSAPTQHGVSFLLTEKSAQGLYANLSMQRVATHYALVNRRTGEFFLPDQVRSGPESIVILDQTRVVCWRLTFSVGPIAVNTDELTLTVFRFEGGELVKRTLDVASIPFALESVPESAVR